MSLPDLALQIAYGRLAWALVAAALLLAVLPAVAQKTKLLIVAALVAWMMLPGAASPAYWLALALQYPSGLLTGCAVVSLQARWLGRSPRFTLPAGLALDPGRFLPADAGVFRQQAGSRIHPAYLTGNDHGQLAP